MSDDGEPRENEGVMWNPWTFRARVERVVDGDTYDLVIDLGFGIRARQRVRLRGIDTHEVYGVAHSSEEYALGSAESAFVREWFAEAAAAGREWPVLIHTRDTGKYGRYIADVWRASDGNDLALALHDEFDLPLDE